MQHEKKTKVWSRRHEKKIILEWARGFKLFVYFWGFDIILQRKWVLVELPVLCVSAFVWKGRGEWFETGIYLIIPPSLQGYFLCWSFQQKIGKRHLVAFGFSPASPVWWWNYPLVRPCIFPCLLEARDREFREKERGRERRKADSDWHSICRRDCSGTFS